MFLHFFILLFLFSFFVLTNNAWHPWSTYDHKGRVGRVDRVPPRVYPKHQKSKRAKRNTRKTISHADSVSNTCMDETYFILTSTAMWPAEWTMLECGDAGDSTVPGTSRCTTATPREPAALQRQFKDPAKMTNTKMALIRRG